MDETLYLCFINHIGKDVDENNIYELLFTTDKDNFFGEDFDYKPCCIINQMTPFEDSYQKVYTFKSKIELDLIQDSCCFGMTDCMDNVVALAYENIDSYEEYPEHRLILHYGITYDDTIAELNKSGITVTEKGED